MSRIKKIMIWIGVAAIFILMFFAVKKVVDVFTKKIENKDYQIIRLQREVKYTNIKYLDFVLKYDSLKQVNDLIQSDFKDTQQQKEYYWGLYQESKKAYSLLNQAGDTITVVDSVFSFADEVISLQEQQILQLEAINTNNNIIIIDLRKELDDTRRVMLDLEQIAIDYSLITKELQEKLAKVKKKRNIWIGIGITEAAFIALMVYLGLVAK